MKRRILLVSILILLVGAIWFATATANPPRIMTDRTNVVTNEQGFWSEVLGLEPEPLANCTELRQWIAEHPSAFRSNVVRPRLAVELQYRPAACIACMEAPESAFSAPTTRERMDRLAGSAQYVLHFTAGSSGGELPLLAESLRTSIVEVVGTDTLPCAFMHVETLPPGVPYASAIIGFDRPQDDLDHRVVLLDHDGALGGTIEFALPRGGASALAQALQPTSTRP